MEVEDLTRKISTKLYLDTKRRSSCKYFHYLNMERVKERKRQLHSTHNNSTHNINTPNFVNSSDVAQSTNNNNVNSHSHEYNNNNNSPANQSDSDQEMSRTDVDQALEDDISFLVDNFHVQETEPTYMPYIC